MNERHVRIVLMMYENVVHIVETERSKQQKIVITVRKTYEHVAHNAETES